MAVFFPVGVALYFIYRKFNKLNINNLWALAGTVAFIVVFATIDTTLSAVPAFVFFAVIIYEKGWISRFLITKPLQYLGTISYSLYLCHPFALYCYC